MFNEEMEREIGEYVNNTHNSLLVLCTGKGHDDTFGNSANDH